MMPATPLTLTPSQTVGPFLHIALADPALRFAVASDAPDAIHITGRLTDGGGAPIPDGLIETWQADGLFARCPTDADGHYEVFTRKPPAVPTVDGTPQAPHVSVSVFSRGLLDRVVTRDLLSGGHRGQRGRSDAPRRLRRTSPPPDRHG